MCGGEATCGDGSFVCENIDPMVGVAVWVSVARHGGRLFGWIHYLVWTSSVLFCSFLLLLFIHNASLTTSTVVDSTIADGSPPFISRRELLGESQDDSQRWILLHEQHIWSASWNAWLCTATGYVGNDLGEYTGMDVVANLTWRRASWWGC
jgi:hypothetical protein